MSQPNAAEEGQLIAGHRRRCFIEISPELLLSTFRMMGPGNLVRVDGLPEDARVVGLTLCDNFSYRPPTIQIALESQALEPVPDGYALPRRDIKIMLRDDGVAGLLRELQELVNDEDLTDEKLREASEGLLPRLCDALRVAGYGEWKT